MASTFFKRSKTVVPSSSTTVPPHHELMPAVSDAFVMPWQGNWQKKLGTDISTDKAFSHAPDSFYLYNEKDDEYIDSSPLFC